LKTVIDSLENSKDSYTYSVQGFGNVGSFFAELVQDRFPNWKLVSVTDSSGGLYSANGLDAHKLAEFKKNKNRFLEYSEPGVSHISNDEIISGDAEILVLAALDGVVNANNSSSVQAEIVMELANGPVDSIAQIELSSRGVVVIPDILANAGGVVVSYLEWVQNIQNEHWSLEEVNNKLYNYMHKATIDVLDKADKQVVDLKDAAFLIAVERLVAAQK
jgi:glutamate dehydrogenase/leucine dehydrogenase